MKGSKFANKEDVFSTTNGWLEEHDQQFFYNGIQALDWRNAGLSAFQLQETMLKSDKI